MALQLKMLMSFLTVFLSSGVWRKTHPCPAGLYVVREDLLGVWWNAEQEGFQCDPLRCDGFFQSPIKREKGLLTNRSQPPK